MTDKLTEAERLTRHEVTLEFLEKQMILNGNIASEGIKALSDKLDAMDAKWDTRFLALEQSHQQDAKELQAFKNKGAGILTALGVVFTATATIFADFFSHVKQIIFGA